MDPRTPIRDPFLCGKHGHGGGLPLQPDTDGRDRDRPGASRRAVGTFATQSRRRDNQLRISVLGPLLGISFSQLNIWVYAVVRWALRRIICAMFSLSHTRTRLVLISQHRLPQVGLVCCVLFLFYGSWTSGPHETAAQVGMGLMGNTLN